MNPSPHWVHILSASAFSNFARYARMLFEWIRDKTNTFVSADGPNFESSGQSQDDIEHNAETEAGNSVVLSWRLDCNS